MFVVAFICEPLLANDSSYGVDNGTISFKYQPEISMDKESLFISEEKIVVDYTFSNVGKKDLDIPMAFPMPPMVFETEEDHSEISDFKLWVNGAPQKTKRKLVVLLDGKTDISDKLARFGWSVDDLERYLYNYFDPEKKNNGVPKGKKPLPASWFKRGEPKFSISEYFVWLQRFPAGKAISIRHSYAPSVSSIASVSGGEIIKSYGKDYCIDEGARAKLKASYPTWIKGGRCANLKYILMTANNWQGAIKEFDLVIEKDNPKEMVSLCFDGELKKTNSRSFEFHQKNFKPGRDLSVLFVR